jgi:hypothetical protein
MSTQAERFQQLVSRFALNGSERIETTFQRKKKPGNGDAKGTPAGQLLAEAVR